ncbi:MAG: hypothetical protein JSR68_08460 [Proteobacteria bacterium]|nr:hypothetical protein [Pseudomonadota bacterium]
MNRPEADAILRLIHFPGYAFRVVGMFDSQQGPTYLQASFMAPCAVEGGGLLLQRTRKWQLSAHMTPSELVQTALKCVLTSLEHEAREHFTYRGAAIFGPHFDVEALVRIADRRDIREEAA